MRRLKEGADSGGAEGRSTPRPRTEVHAERRNALPERQIWDRQAVNVALERLEKEDRSRRAAGAEVGVEGAVGRRRRGERKRELIPIFSASGHADVPAEARPGWPFRPSHGLPW